MFSNNAKVVLDSLNSLIHMKCYAPSDYDLKDQGTYKEIIEKYDFFEELRIFN